MRLKEIHEFEKSLLLGRFVFGAQESMLALGSAAIKFQQVMKIGGLPCGSDFQAHEDQADESRRGGRQLSDRRERRPI